MNIRIAIAEDNEFLINTLVEKLSFFEDLVVKFTALNGKDLLQKLKKDCNIDIILMDIQMPEMNGIEATEIIKKKYPQIKVMMLTIFDDDENIFQSIKAGATGYVLKETKPLDLHKSIKEILKDGAPMTPCIALKALNLLKNPVESFTRNEDNIILSKRQTEILEQLSTGLNYKQIANNLNISSATVRKHIENIYKNLQVHNKIEAIKKAQQKRIIN